MSSTAAIDIDSFVPLTGLPTGEPTDIFDPKSKRQLLASKAHTYVVKITSHFKRAWLKITKIFSTIRRKIADMKMWIAVKFQRWQTVPTYERTFWRQQLDLLGTMVLFALQLAFAYIVFVWALLAAFSLFGWI